jgi:hypothetical protein
LQETGGFFCVFVTALTHFGGVEWGHWGVRWCALFKSTHREPAVVSVSFSWDIRTHRTIMLKCLWVCKLDGTDSRWIAEVCASHNRFQRVLVIQEIWKTFFTYEGFKFLSVLTLKITMFCGVKLSTLLEDYRRFGRIYCIYLQVNPEDGENIVMI